MEICFNFFVVMLLGWNYNSRLHINVWWKGWRFICVFSLSNQCHNTLKMKWVMCSSEWISTSCNQILVCYPSFWMWYMNVMIDNLGIVHNFNLQQCDVIFKPKHFRLHALLIIHNDKIFFCQIHEDLKNIFSIGMDQN